MPCSSSRSARVAMSDHPRPQRLGLRRLLMIVPAFLVEPDLRRLDEFGTANMGYGIGRVILSTPNNRGRIDPALYGSLKFQPRGLLWILVRFPRREVQPEGIEPTSALV